LFTDEWGVSFFGAYQRLVDFGAAVVTVMPYGDVFRGSVATIQRNIIAGVIVLALSILCIAFFARTLAKPLTTLTVAARSIEEGTYDVPLPADRSDEIGVLTAGFRDMITGQRNLERFSNKMILRLARAGKLTRTGVSRRAVVCFTYIRDFHEKWEEFQAEQTVAFVNDYLSRIVPCITGNGGIVDKFLTQKGVVVMALWGAAAEEETDEGENARSCVTAALAMRSALKGFNAERLHNPDFKVPGDRRLGMRAPLVRMGCGINAGEVVEGQIGSEERMEYTVIGDTVNMASRIEEPNDLFDTDILITARVQELVKDQVHTLEMPALEVKGKADEVIRTFAVLDTRENAEAGGIRTVEELREFWNIQEGGL
jgi:adenylate cyclase